MVPIARFDRAILYAMHVHGGPAGMTGAKLAPGPQILFRRKD
jgi:hypothetical protein